MRSGLRAALLLPVLLLTSAFTLTEPQPVPHPDEPDEPAAQEVPPSNHPLWGELAGCPSDFDTKTARYRIALTPQVKAMAGRIVSASGFVLPLDGAAKTRHFLLTRHAPVCSYRRPGEPNEVIEVNSKRPVDRSGGMVTVKGRFVLVNDGEKAIFFAIRDAEQIK